MERKIAIPSSNGRLDPHFGHCSEFVIMNVENSVITGESVMTAPPHEPGLLPRWLSGMGVTDVIAGGMGQRAIQIFNQHSVNVFTGAPVMTPREVAEGFLNGQLEFRSNYCDH